MTLRRGSLRLSLSEGPNDASIPARVWWRLFDHGTTAENVTFAIVDRDDGSRSLTLTTPPPEADDV